MNAEPPPSALGIKRVATIMSTCDHVGRRSDERIKRGYNVRNKECQAVAEALERSSATCAGHCTARVRCAYTKEDVNCESDAGEHFSIDPSENTRCTHRLALTVS